MTVPFSFPPLFSWKIPSAGPFIIQDILSNDKKESRPKGFLSDKTYLPAITKNLRPRTPALLPECLCPETKTINSPRYHSASHGASSGKISVTETRSRSHALSSSLTRITRPGLPTSASAGGLQGELGAFEYRLTPPGSSLKIFRS